MIGITISPDPYFSEGAGTARLNRVVGIVLFHDMHVIPTKKEMEILIVTDYSTCVNL